MKAKGIIKELNYYSMKKNRGLLYELKDGRLGIAYEADQAAVKDDCRLLKQVDENMKPVLADHNHRQAVLIQNVKDLTVKGYIN